MTIVVRYLQKKELRVFKNYFTEKKLMKLEVTTTITIKTPIKTTYLVVRLIRQSHNSSETFWTSFIFWHLHFWRKIKRQCYITNSSHDVGNLAVNSPINRSSNRKWHRNSWDVSWAWPLNFRNCKGQYAMIYVKYFFLNL